MLIDIGILNHSTRVFARKSYMLRHKWSTVHGVKEACTLERVERRVFYRWKKTLSLLKDKDDIAGETRVTEQVKKIYHGCCGCTYLCQPIDVGINKPIKNAVAEHWEDWADIEGMGEGRERKIPSRELISSWVGEAYWTRNTKTCENASNKKGYGWKI